MKKFLAVVLAVLMVAGVCMVPVMAEEQETLPDAFYVYSGETGVTQMSGVPAMSGWTVCQTVNIDASTGKVGIAQLSPNGEFWDTGVIYDIATGMISSQLGESVTVSTSKVTAAGPTFFAVTFDGTTELVYVNGVLAATITGFDAASVPEYLAPAYVCADGCYDATKPGFTTDAQITTAALSVFSRVLSAVQIATIYDSLGLGDSNYSSVVSDANVWYSIDNTKELVVKHQVIDMASIKADTSFMANGYTKVTTIMIPEKTYEEGSMIGIAQIRGAVAGSFYASVAYDLGTGLVSMPWIYKSGVTWWVIDEQIARPATGNVQFIETMDGNGNICVYVNGQLAMKAHPNAEATDASGSLVYIMNFIKGGDAYQTSNSVMVLGDYLNPKLTNTYDAHFYDEVNGAYNGWQGSYVDNSYTRYGTIVLSAKGYKLEANAGAIPSFYKGGAGVDSLKSASNLNVLGNWYNEEFFNLSNVDNPIIGLTAPYEYTYNNDGISLGNGYTKVAVYYIPDNSNGKIKENEGWINVFTDVCVNSIDETNAYDGIRYDIGSGKVLSTLTANFYRWGQVAHPVKTSGFTVFAMTFDGHALRVWVNGELAFYASDNEALPANSLPYGAYAQTTGRGLGERGLTTENHATAIKNSYNGNDAYQAFGVMLSYEAGYTGVANQGAIEELTASAAKIASNLAGTHIHTWGEWNYTGEGALEPTCTKGGVQTRTCSGCGKLETKAVPANGHTWGAWTVTKEPTLTENGSKFRTCSTCQETQTVEIEPLISAVNYNGVMGKTPYFTFDFSEEGGLTDIFKQNLAEKSEAFTSQTKISVLKIPNRVYASGSLVAIAPVSTGDLGFDIGAAYDLGTGLVSPLSTYYTDIVTQNAVKATGVVEFVEIVTATDLKVYVNGELALHSQNSGDAEAYRDLFTSGKYKVLHANLAGDKESNVYARYGVKTMYGAAYNDVEVTDAMITKMYKMSTPALEQIIDTSAIPAYKNITGKSAWRPATNFLTKGGTGLVTKDMMSSKITSQLVKITVLNIPDVAYTEDMTVGISLLSLQSETGSYDWSVQYNLKTGEVSPATTTDGALFLKDIATSTPVKATGYVQFVEIFNGTHLDVYVNGQLAFSANVVADEINATVAGFMGGTYRRLTLNATGDGKSDAAEKCNGVKTMYFVGFVNPTTTMTAASVTAMHEMFLASLSRTEQPAPEPVCTHEHTEIRNATAADCTHTGYTGDTYCTDCNEKLASGNVIPKTDHNYVNGVCTVCGATQVLEGFITKDGKLYYYEKGKVKTGWFVVDGKTYYGSSATGVCVNYDKVLGGKQYFWNDETGLVLANGFYEVTGGTVCYQNGYQVIGWRHTDGSGPVVDEKGISEQYSSSPNNLYYFLSTTGFMVTDSTYKLGGFTREFNNDHTVKPLNGLQNRYGELYYYVNGVIQTGWHTIDGNTYYFRASDAVYGRAATKWMYIGNKVYYFYASTSATPYALKTSGAIGGITYNYAEDGHKIGRAHV